MTEAMEISTYTIHLLPQHNIYIYIKHYLVNLFPVSLSMICTRSL